MSVCEEMKTPYFLINLNRVEQNYTTFNNAIERNNRKDIIAYSIKANYDRNIIDKLKHMGAYFEICSNFEFNKLCEYEVDLKKVIINGLFRSKNEIMNYIDNGSLVIFDTISQLRWIQNIDYPIQIGIRLNIDYIKNDDSLYGCKISRFGIDVRDNEIFDLIQKNKNIMITCLHCHFSGNSRDPLIYAAITTELCRIIRENRLSSVKMIDIGGGYKIAPQFWSFNDYVHTVTSTLVKQAMEHLTVIYEPGNSLVRTSCSYITKIIDEKNMNGISYLTVDGTRLHLSPKNERNKFDYKVKQQQDGIIVSKQLIVGSTCKESDIILELNNIKRLSVGETIQFDNLGAYLINEISDFLMHKPEIYYCDQCGCELEERN
ncbi:hypothetical protein I5677_07090 [Mobilitalea sibirica]|uniref:Orn/DAP/Arg decarboxylase 2 N-terminal domain-containing protein n=1 Tax=Mobilitalea sibirica TaxID=1462919 RepID=A0A8J7H2E1_9FIRM|nr:hypothetical protein [Mobilitalea sibirica]MBH1940650.1 hypothetical protein [Mobilitalea sibirica]